MTDDEFRDEITRIQNHYDEVDLSEAELLEFVRSRLATIKQIMPAYRRVQDPTRASMADLTLQEIEEGLTDPELLEEWEIRDLAKQASTQVFTMEHVMKKVEAQPDRRQGLLGRLFGRK